jgi:hypothetical protein
MSGDQSRDINQKFIPCLQRAVYNIGRQKDANIYMAKRKLITAVVSLGAAFIFLNPAPASAVVLTLPSYYDSPNGYDFVTTFPAAGSTTIGTFTFSIPASALVTGITISGSFGNSDNGTTALSDYYLGFAGHETAVEVAGCDSILANCYSNQNGPTTWSYTLTSANLSSLGSAIAGGSLDFTYTWDNNAQFAFPGYDQYVYAGDPTLTIQVAPEPASVTLCLCSLAGITVLRRFRRVNAASAITLTEDLLNEKN